MKISARLLAALACLPALALAQTSPPARETASARGFNEVERGVFLGVQAGGLFLLSAPFQGPFSPGQSALVEAGFDLGERVSVSGFAMVTANRAGADYLGKSAGLASGDFSAFVPGASVRVNAWGFADAQEIKRTWLYVRAGAGVALFSPRALLPDPDVLLFAGPGVTYHTRLRHFSVGLEVTGTFLVASGSAGFAVTPNVRYAF
jgi:hypothetical protein